MSAISIKSALAGAAAEGTEVTVKGWVRTRRDSKAGLSFVNLSDGSCFDAIQIVAPDTLPNYASDVLRLTAGCGVIAPNTFVRGRRCATSRRNSIECGLGWIG